MSARFWSPFVMRKRSGGFIVHGRKTPIREKPQESLSNSLRTITSGNLSSTQLTTRLGTNRSHQQKSSRCDPDTKPTENGISSDAHSWDATPERSELSLDLGSLNSSLSKSYDKAGGSFRKKLNMSKLDDDEEERILQEQVEEALQKLIDKELQDADGGYTMGGNVADKALSPRAGKTSSQQDAVWFTEPPHLTKNKEYPVFGSLGLAEETMSSVRRPSGVTGTVLAQRTLAADCSLSEEARKYFPVTLGEVPNIMRTISPSFPPASPEHIDRLGTFGREHTLTHCSLDKSASISSCPPGRARASRRNYHEQSHASSHLSTGQSYRLANSSSTEKDTASRRNFPEQPHASSHLSTGQTSTSVTRLSSTEKDRSSRRNTHEQPRVSDPFATGKTTLSSSRDRPSQAMSQMDRQRSSSNSLYSNPQRQAATDYNYLKASQPYLDGSVVATPYQYELAQLKMERLRLEEQQLLTMKREDELERIRGPQPKWYELKTPKFTYEHSKNNQLIRSQKDWQELLDYRSQLLNASRNFGNETL